MPRWGASFAALLLTAACGSTSEGGLFGRGGTDHSEPDGGPQDPGADGGAPDAGPIVGFYPLRPSPIAAENARPGSSAWECPNFNPNLGAYANRSSYLPGELVEVHAAFAGSPTSASWQLWRMGYYAGARGRLVASGGPVSVPAQTPVSVDPQTGAVSARWPAAFSFTVPADAVTGIYLIKLSSPQGDTLAPLVVREKSPRAVILYPVSTNTYQAYNTWGGTSLYVNDIGWSPPGWTDPTKPGHAFAVSFDRPYRSGSGTGDFLDKDRDFVTFAEGQGYDIAYAADTDFDADASLAAHRRMLVVQGHSEYWTRGMRDATEAAIAQGTHTAFFAANNGYWQVRFQDSARRLLIGYKQYCALDPIQSTDPSLQTCLWRETSIAPINRPENAMIGEQYGEWIWSAAPMQVDDPSSWIWTGAGVDQNATIAGVYGNEIDRRFDNGVEPPGVNDVASALIQSYFGMFEQAQTTLYAAPSGAQVFSAGSIAWSKSLAGPGTWDPRIQQVVANLFSKFAGDGTLGPAALKPLQMAPGAPRPSYRAG